MGTVAFDTHEYVKELKDAGFSEQQAEVITKLQKNTLNSTLEQARHDYELDNIATTLDLKELELKLDARIRELELKLSKDIAESKAELVRWVVAVGLLQMTLIAGLLLKLTHAL